MRPTTYVAHARVDQYNIPQQWPICMECVVTRLKQGVKQPEDFATIELIDHHKNERCELCNVTLVPLPDKPDFLGNTWDFISSRIGRMLDAIDAMEDQHDD